MGRKPCYDQTGRKKGTWSPEEDKKLRDYILRYGHWNWRELPKFAGLARCGRSCRLRWMNYLRPNIKRGDFTKQEDDIIIRSHEELGNKWSVIAAKLPGRTDHEIKNHWHSHLKKQLYQHKSTTNLGKIDQQSNKRREIEAKEVIENILGLSDQPVLILESSSSSEISNLSFGCPLLPCGMNNKVMEDISSTPLEPIVQLSDQLFDDFWTEPFLADSVFFNQNDDLISSLLVEGGLFLTPYDHMSYDDGLDYSFPPCWL